MTWDQYQSAFVARAERSGKSRAYVKRCLDYAAPLFAQDLPVIFDANHIAKLTGRSAQYLYSMTRFPRCHYRSFSIAKKGGGERHIDEPEPDLKCIQRWILDDILTHLPVSPYAKAYIQGSSIRDNARFHRNQETVLTVDIKDFFPSIRRKSVFFVFRKAGYSDTVAAFLANLCCLEDCLPQGAPTSPMLSNIIFSDLDAAIAEFTSARGLRYTRYADDITISGRVDIRETLRFLHPLLNARGFRLNPEKTRVLGRNMRQSVTGIVVNRYLQVPVEVRKDLRQQVYYIRKFGLDSHMDRIGTNSNMAHVGESGINYIERLIGLAGHALFVNPGDEEMREYYQYLRGLRGAEPGEAWPN